MSAGELDLEGRRLCPDGACVGVIGADGRCRVCGRRDDGAQQGVATAWDEEDADADAEADADADADADAHANAEDADEERRLCPDEGCVGLVGEDGRCKICGLSAVS